MRQLKYLFGIVIAAAIVTSCKTPKDITYLQNHDSNQAIATIAANDITAMPGDKISIVVHSQDAQLAEIFNMPIQARRLGNTIGRQTSASNHISTYSNGEISPYVVDFYGDITFPVLGELHVGGLNRHQISAMIKDEIVNRQLLKDPTVTVQFVDHAFTVLGSVGQPGRVLFDRDRITLIEALGLAGDLNIDGKRTNVKVFRTVDNKEIAYEVDLTDANSLYQSPAYYVMQNDIIYVEPNDKAKRNTTAAGNTSLQPSFWVSLASLATTIAVLFVK